MRTREGILTNLQTSKKTRSSVSSPRTSLIFNNVPYDSVNSLVKFVLFRKLLRFVSKRGSQRRLLRSIERSKKRTWSLGLCEWLVSKAPLATFLHKDGDSGFPACNLFVVVEDVVQMYQKWTCESEQTFVLSSMFASFFGLTLPGGQTTADQDALVHHPTWNGHPQTSGTNVVFSASDPRIRFSEMQRQRGCFIPSNLVLQRILRRDTKGPF